jgi:hypothetical protein
LKDASSLATAWRSRNGASQSWKAARGFSTRENHHHPHPADRLARIDRHDHTINRHSL